MSLENDVLLRRIARYSVPAVILAFYLSAVQRFEYTPESTFASLAGVIGIPSPDPGVSTSPLWSGLLLTARSVGVDPLLAAKVLSLLFSGLAIQTVFLLAMEVHRSLFPALAVVLMFAMQGWVAQAAVSGHPFVCGMMLLLGALFFLARNEYPVSAILIGLAILVFWQALLFLPVLAVDAVVNSTEKGAGFGRAMRALAAALGVCALWTAIALSSGRGVIPVMPPFSEFATPDVWEWGAVVLMSGALAAGLVLLLLKVEQGRRIALALFPPVGTLLVLALVSLSANQELSRAGLPVLFAVGLFGIRLLLERWNDIRRLQHVLLLMIGLTLVQSQLALYGDLSPRMARETGENRELAAIAVWVRAHAPADVRVFSERPAVLAYYAERPVATLSDRVAQAMDLVVAVRPPVTGAIALYTLPVPVAGQSLTGAGYTVWRDE